MSADLLRHSPRPGPRPGPRLARVRASSSAPLSGRPSSTASDSSSSVSSTGSTGSHRNKTLLKTYHDFAMQIFNPGHAHDVENLFVAAARDGDYERVENFLRRRSHEIVNIDVKEKRTGNTPILWAAKSGHLKVVQLLLKYGADVTIRNFDNETALDVAKPGIRTVLLQSVERAGCSPRHLLQAAWQGNIDVVQRLLNESKVLDINCRNADGYTPLLLVTRDVDVFEQIGAALESYSPQAVVKELLLHRADLTTHDVEGRTPLHFAAASKAKLSEEIAVILMSEPAVVEMRDRRSLAPIHSASQSGQVEILVALLDSGADVNARGYAGATPLHISAYSGQLQAATKLLNHGADVTLVDDSGNTPVDVAKTKKLKHTLREAWTEATQAKRDMVLTPVKPPSRMAESRGPLVEERSTQDSMGSTPSPALSMNCTPEKRIIRQMTEAHKAILAEEQILRDIESGRFTPSSSLRKLGLPRASSRNGTSPGKLPVPPKTPRVLEHTPGTSPEKTKKASRSLFGGRSRTHTVPGGDGTAELRNQRARAHAKVNQRNSDPVVSKVATDMPQVPVTVVGLDLDENLRDIRFQRLVSGPIAPFLERYRSHERVDISVNPIPPSDRRPSAGRRDSNPSVHDLTGVCIDYIRKGRKYQRSVGSCSSTTSIDDESTLPPKRVPFRANMQTHPLNLEQMHLRLSTPSPMLDPTQLFNPTSRHVMPLSPSQYSENIQETIFEFDEDKDEQTENRQSHSLYGSPQNVDLKDNRNINSERLPLTRTKSILNQSKSFSIENTRVVDPAKEVSTDSGQGSRTTNSISSSASPLSTPSPLLPRADRESQFIRNSVTNRLGVNMTPSATTVKDATFKARTLHFAAKSASTALKSSASKKIDTSATTEISLHSAKTLVVENSEKVPTSLGKQLPPTKTLDVGDTSKNDPSKSSVLGPGNRTRKISSNSLTSSSGSVLGKTNNTREEFNAREADIGVKLENSAVTKKADLESESKRTNHKRESSSEVTVTHLVQEAKATTAVNLKKHETVANSTTKKDAMHETVNNTAHKTAVKVATATNGKNHETVVESHTEKDVERVTVNKVNHETAVVKLPGKLLNTSRPAASKAESDSRIIQGSNSIRLNSNSKSSSSSGSSHSSSRKTSTMKQPIHETAVGKILSQVKPSSENGQTSANGTVNQCNSAETKLLFGRLTGQGSCKQKVDPKSDPGGQKSDPGGQKSDLGGQKLDPKASMIRTSVESIKKSSCASKEGKLPPEGNKQGKLLSPQKAGILKADTPSNKVDSPSASSEMPKVSPRPGYNQGSKSPAGSTERASPRIQTSKGEPSLSKSFGSGSSQTKTEIRNMVQGAKQNKNKPKSNQKQLFSSDEGVGLELEEQIDRLCTSDEEQLFQSQKIILDPKNAKAKKTEIESCPGMAGKSLEQDAKVKQIIPSVQTKGQNGIKKSKDFTRPQSSGSKSDSVESIEEVYEEVVFVSDEEKGEHEKSNIKTQLPQDVVRIHIKEVDMVKKAKVSKQKKIVRKMAGRIIPAMQTQQKDQKDSENKIGGLSKSALRAVGKSVSEAKLQGQEPTVELPMLHLAKNREKLATATSDVKEETGMAKESMSPKSPNTPKPKTPKIHWAKFKSPEVSPRSDSSVEIPHDPRIIKEHTPIIQDVMECMQMMHLQSMPTPIPWKPREKISSTSSCPTSNRPSTLVKTRRRIASTKEPPKRPAVKGSLRKIAIMGQSTQKGKGRRPGSAGKLRQKDKKKLEQDAISTQKKEKPKAAIKAKTKGNLKQDKLHLLSQSDSTTKAFITGQGWHIQTEKNETSDVIIHDRSALDSSSDSSSEAEGPMIIAGSPKLSPHNTLMLNELCKIHSLSTTVINNIANIMSPLEGGTPHFIPDTMGAIKEFGDSLKSNSSSETDQQNQASPKKKFTFEKEALEKLAIEAGSNQKEPLKSRETARKQVDARLANTVSDSSVKFKPHTMDRDKELSSGLGPAVVSNEGKIHQVGVFVGENNGSVPNTPRIITSEASGNLTERSDVSYGNGEDLSSYETNPEFLKVFRLKDPATPSESPESVMFRTELRNNRVNKMNMQVESELPESSTEHNPENISHKPPLSSKTNTTISELTRVPRGSIKRRHSEPPAKVSQGKPEGKPESAEKVESTRRVIRVMNSWKDEPEVKDPDPVFAEDQVLKARSNWRERSQVENMISPLKSRLPDKSFSPPSSSKDSPTMRRGNSMPEVVSPYRQQDEQRKNKKRTSEEASNPNPPSQRKPSNYSEDSEVFLNDVAAADDEDGSSGDVTIHDKEQMLTEHVQHMSVSAMQELNTVLSQSGDVRFEFPSPTLRPYSRDGDAEAVGFEPEVSDWLNQSLTASEASEATTRTFSAMSSEMHNTHSSGLSSERSHSSSTNLSESEGGQLHWKKGNILGRGAFGVVFCGLTNTGQLIAVKQVELSDKDNKHKSRQQYEKLQVEVELLKTLRHRNIVGFLGVSLEGNTVNIFMQYIPGGSIASLLARFGALEEPVFCRYTKQILQGTEYLHDKNVIHRDIKGANIMLMSNGVIKLIDFGCAKRLCINISQSQNLLKSMRGTPYWMAPEVIMETGHGKKSDMWSIGCTVFEMATRKPPWSEMPPMTAIFAIGSGGPVPQLPERFSCFAREFVDACLTRDQNERPTATQLLTHSFIRKRRERGRDRFETRISSSTMEDANITFKEQLGSEDGRHQTEKRNHRRDNFS